MYDPNNVENVLSMQEVDLQRLPSAEDERHEYKSSLVSDNDLADKVGRAASGFWNSGGGLFAVGVAGNGQPDGGVSNSVGRQSRRDWFDQALARVSPRGRYFIQAVAGQGAGTNIGTGKSVYLISFAPSEFGPHMAADKKYYIRAGAHTEAASHFVVEAIFARRSFNRPLLSYTLRRKPSVGGVIQLGILALGNAPALDVEIAMDPIPEWLQQAHRISSPLRVPVISDQHPFFFDVDLLTIGPKNPVIFDLKLSFSDIAGTRTSASFNVDVDRQMGPVLMGAKDAEHVVRQLSNIEKSIDKLVSASGRTSDAIKEISRKLR